MYTNEKPPSNFEFSFSHHPSSDTVVIVSLPGVTLNSHICQVEREEMEE